MPWRGSGRGFAATERRRPARARVCSRRHERRRSSVQPAGGLAFRSLKATTSRKASPGRTARRSRGRPACGSGHHRPARHPRSCPALAELEAGQSGSATSSISAQTYIKALSCCRHVRALVDALSHADRSASNRSSAIESRRGRMSIDGALQICRIGAEPATRVDVQFSIPYCLGLIAIDRTESALLPLTERCNRSRRCHRNWRAR